MSARSLARRLGAAALALVGAIGLGGAALAAPASPDAAPFAPDRQGAGALESFGACLSGGGQADLLLLVDESSSLLGSDPGVARVTSATYFVDQLAQYVDDGGAPIDLGLGTFAHGAESILPWTSLTSSSLGSVRDSIATLQQRVEGFDTDYWTALDWAQRELSAKSASSSGEAPRCQAIVMFTDGKLDYSPRTTSQEQQLYGTEKVFAPGIQLTTQQAADQVREAARNDICREGGLADQLTSSGVKLFGIGLSADPAGAGDFDLFQAIVTGAGGGGATCGTLGLDDRGEFFLANDIDSLLFAFDAFSNPVRRPIEITQGICQVAPCSSEAHEFVLDTSTPDVRILAQADVPNLDVTIQMPNGAIVAFPKGQVGAEATLDQDGASFRYTWESDKTIAISATRSSATQAVWMGLWQLAFTDPTGQSAGQQSRSNIHITGSLLPAAQNADALEFHTGDTVELELGITDKRSGAIDPQSIPGDMGFSASIVDAAGTEFPVLDTQDKGGLDAPASVSLADAAVGQAELRLQLDITTAPATRPDGSPVPGTTLEPALVSLPITILTPADFPTVGQSIDFGNASGTVDLRATLPVSGSGCVWVAADDAPSVVASPEGIGAVSVTASGHDSPEACFEAGSADGIELALRTEQAGNGTINGTVPVMLGPVDGTASPIRVDVPFTASLEKPLNTLNFVLVLIAAPILGIGVPILLLYLAKWFISKIPARPLVGAVVPVRVEHGQVLRDGGRFELGPRDLTGTIPVPSGGGRTLRVGDITLRAKTGASPTGAGFVTVDAPGRASAGSASPSTDASGVRARLPLAVHNTWVVLHPDGAPGDTAQLLVLVGGDATPASRGTLQDDINRRLPGLLEKLVRERGGAPAGGEFAQVGSPFQGGGSPFQGGGGSQPPGVGGAPSAPGGTSPWGTV